VLLPDAGPFPNRFPLHDLARDMSLELVDHQAANARAHARDPLATFSRASSCRIALFVFCIADGVPDLSAGQRLTCFSGCRELS
jgi:hypothetical protein